MPQACIDYMSQKLMPEVNCICSSKVIGRGIQWTLLNPALVNPVLGLTRSKTQGTNHSEPD
jgi:hypothetical protein